MKKFLLLLLSLLMLLCSCKNEAAIDCQVLGARICASLAHGEDFQNADDDFKAATLDFITKTDESVLLLDTSDGAMREIGLFHVEKTSDVKEIEQKIRDYLKGESEALHSLMALYPTDDLHERLWRYQNATLLTKDSYIAYFVLSHEEMQTAKTLFLTALTA